MVLGFNSPTKEEAKRFDREMLAHEESNALDVASKMANAAQYAYDAQVSAQLLGNNRRLLQYKELPIKDTEGNVVDIRLVCVEKFPFTEMYLDEALSALPDDQARKDITFISGQAINIYSTVKKYERSLKVKYGEQWFEMLQKEESDLFSELMNWVADYNDIVLNSINGLVMAKVTGKNMKLAKSQYVDSSTSIQRGAGFGVPPKKRFLGIF